MTSRDDERVPDAVQRAFEELGRISLAEHSLDSVVDTVARLARRVLPGEPITSVTVVQEGRPATVAWSGRLARDLDETQYRLGDGPCLVAAGTGTPADVPDTGSSAEWTEFATRAAELGCRSVLSYPLTVREPVSGALNVYGSAAPPAGHRTRELVSRFAAHAVVPVSNAYLYESAVERAGHLRAALGSRAVIDQAKGILMERRKLTADQAFEVLARTSMQTNTKLRSVAEALVRSGQLPGE